MNARLLIGGLIGLGCGSCFVSEGECVQRGVQVTPCAISVRAGQTLVLQASVPGDPSAPVIWELAEATEDAFEGEENGNQIVLISKRNVQGVYPVQATSADNPSLYGGTAVGVSSATFGGQAPPIVMFGGDFPVTGRVGATAAGGERYYVAYAANPPSGSPQDSTGQGPEIGMASAPASFVEVHPHAGPSPATNYFVKQFDAGTNQLLVSLSGQFLSFTGQATSVVAPNIEADCHGTGYWIDRDRKSVV